MVDVDLLVVCYIGCLRLFTLFETLVGYNYSGCFAVLLDFGCL